MNKAQSLKDRLRKMIEREIDRCKAKLGPDGWNEHGEWVIQDIVASAKLWVSQQAAKGVL